MPERSARNTAMDLLAQRDHSRLELEQKLAQRGFDADEIESALNHLQRHNLQSDRRYAEAFLEQRRARGYGPVRIEYELRDRGVNDAIISDCLQLAQDDWLEVLESQRAKKYGPTIPNDYPQRMKQARFLQNRGFSSEMVMRLFR
jgi:regulatory protein